MSIKGSLMKTHAHSVGSVLSHLGKWVFPTSKKLNFLGSQTPARVSFFEWTPTMVAFLLFSSQVQPNRVSPKRRSQIIKGCPIVQR